MKRIIIGFSLFVGATLHANNRKLDTITYAHSTVGTTAQDAALTPSSVDSKIRGWRICHDGGSASAYLAISNGADPDTDGLRIAAGACYLCDECGSKGLIEANVKASAASTGYSVLQFK